MKLEIEKNWKTYATILGLVVLTGYYIYWRGKKSNPDNLPNPQDQPGATITAIEAAKIKDIATRLHDDMKGWTFFSAQRDDQAYKDFLQMSDKLFVATYNQFNNTYYNEGYGTLTQWFKDENFSFNLGFDMYGVIDSIKQRLASLQLS
jgi:hypothetical protein